jgi:diguanylate cyclase (GGDEF)-like protein
VPEGAAPSVLVPEGAAPSVPVHGHPGEDAERRRLTALYRYGLLGRLLVLSLDLDGFKAINDTFGHATGDLLLIGVADRLQECVRRHDTVCRLGGDEFVLLAHDPIDRNGRIEELVARIATTMDEPFVVEGQVLPVGMTIGGVSTTAAAHRPDELLRGSDAALYDAKRRCRGWVELVDDRAHAAGS